jgi:hypothetical protein
MSRTARPKPTFPGLSPGQRFVVEIASTLNRGRLPKGLSALVEQRAGPKESDVLTIEARPKRRLGDELDGNG